MEKKSNHDPEPWSYVLPSSQDTHHTQDPMLAILEMEVCCTLERKGTSTDDGRW